MVDTLCILEIFTRSQERRQQKILSVPMLHVLLLVSLIVRPVIVHSCKNITSRVPWMNAWIHQLTNEITRHTMRHINSNHVTKHKTPNYYLRAEGGGGRLSSSANISFFYCANNNNISNYRNRGQIKKENSTFSNGRCVLYYSCVPAIRSVCARPNVWFPA